VQGGLDTFCVEGRVAAMILYLARQADRFNALPKVRLEFNCAGFKVIKPRYEVFEDEVPIG
jgi:hypothetical protein